MMKREDAEAMIKSLNLAGHAAEKMRATAEAEDLKFFLVTNSAGRREAFIASSAKYAKILALNCGLVQSTKNATVRVPNELYWKGQEGFRGAVEKAISARKPGRIEQKGSFAILHDKVYTPMGIVE